MFTVFLPALWLRTNPEERIPRNHWRNDTGEFDAWYQIMKGPSQSWRGDTFMNYHLGNCSSKPMWKEDQ